MSNLLIESSESGTFYSVNSSSNVVSSVSPFDTNNCVPFNANYLNGYTSENRELDIIDMKLKISKIASIVSDNKMQESIVEEYDREVKLNDSKVDIIGDRWNSAYIPVWLYTYQEKNGERYHYDEREIIKEILEK